MDCRQANQGDAGILSQLIYSSAPNALAAIFDINDAWSALNFLDSSLLTAKGQYGYANHWVTEIDNQVAGCFSLWHCDLPAAFHQATLSKLTRFYGINHTLSVVLASQALQDCIPKPKKNELCIGHFAVPEQYQRQGVATNLLRIAQTRALVAKKSVLCLDVESSNSQAIDFYLRRGFTLESESVISQRMQALGIGSQLHFIKKLI
jgi:ribosomal protein S18 acetylase RimI-like enzyme